MIDGNSRNESALPFEKTGFFKRLRIVLITRSAMICPLSVYREKNVVFL